MDDPTDREIPWLYGFAGVVCVFFIVAAAGGLGPLNSLIEDHWFLVRTVGMIATIGVGIVGFAIAFKRFNLAEREFHDRAENAAKQYELQKDRHEELMRDRAEERDRADERLRKTFEHQALLEDERERKRRLEPLREAIEGIEATGKNRGFLDRRFWNRIDHYFSSNVADITQLLVDGCLDRKVAVRAARDFVDYIQPTMDQESRENRDAVMAWAYLKMAGKIAEHITNVSAIAEYTKDNGLALPESTFWGWSEIHDTETLCYFFENVGHEIFGDEFFLVR